MTVHKGKIEKEEEPFLQIKYQQNSVSYVAFTG
jgi:hypothetical protein